MENFEFKSQVATTKEQSEKLLALGLKKESADMVYHYHNSRTETMRWELRPHPPVLRSNCHFNIERLNVLKQKNSDGVVMSGEEYFDVLWGKDIPAWSLARLIELMPEVIFEALLCVFKDSIRYEALVFDRIEVLNDVVSDNMYDNAIATIEWLIKEGYFNKDYLEDKK